MELGVYIMGVRVCMIGVGVYMVGYGRWWNTLDN